MVTVQPNWTFVGLAGVATTWADALREVQYRTSRESPAKAARSFDACATACSCCKRANLASMAARPSAVTIFGCGEARRSGSSSKVSSVSLTKALLMRAPLLWKLLHDVLARISTE